MKIGVIGLGHIGYPIANHLHSLGHDVQTWTRTEKNVPWINSVQLDESIEYNFDAIFLASGAARPNRGGQKLELESTLDLVSDFTLPIQTKIFYISSGAIYGECKTPQSELSGPNPTTDYGRAKVSTEKALFARFGNQLSVLRVGNIIDEENPYGIVAHLASAVDKRFIEFLGTPSDCRDYLAISDFLKCVQRITELSFAPNVLNVGAGVSISLEQIANLLKVELGDEFKIIWGERRFGDLSQTRLNVDKLNLELQLEPADPVHGLAKLISVLARSNHLSD